MNKKDFRLKEIIVYLIPTLIIDLLIQVGVMSFCAFHFNYSEPRDMVMKEPGMLLYLVIGFVIASIIESPKLYERRIKVRTILFGALSQTFLSLLFCALAINFIHNSFAGKLYLLVAVSSTLAVFFANLALKRIILFARQRGRNKIHVIIAGSEPGAIHLYRNLSTPDQYDYKVLGIFADGEVPSDFKKLGRIADIENYVRGNKVHNLFCSLSPATNSDTVNSLVRLCENSFVDFFYIPDMSGYMNRSMKFNSFEGVNVLSLREEPLSKLSNKFIKRVCDILVSGLFLVTLFPFIWLFVAIGTTISSPGPIFFKQKRTGYRGKSFTMYKFRSMKVNTSSDTQQATKDDERKTRFGNFLRKTSIDEIPQMINVFLGDMSLVGPRPHMEYHTKVYSEIIDKYMVRHMVKPGITGWAQVSGFRGETRTLDLMEGRVLKDIWYIENWSVYLDIKIVLMTVLQLLKGDKQAY